MKVNFFLTTLVLVTFVGCKKNAFFPSDIEKQNVKIVRFDKALYEINEENATEKIDNLYKNYENFMPFFTQDILGIAQDDKKYLAETLPKFINDTIYNFKDLNKKAIELFENIDTIQNELNDAFSKIKYLYPQAIIPTIYLYFSGMNGSIYFFGNDIAVGTDMYLGADYPFYNGIFYEYQKKNMKKECVSLDIVSAYLFNNVHFTSRESRLLENMIYRGKIMFLLCEIYNYKPEYEIMAYSKEQHQWCKKNESAIWHKIMDNGDLFKNDRFLINEYLNDGPFTQPISQSSPARLGTWIGMQITKSYIKNNKNVSLKELLEEGDAQKILQHSKYNP